MADAQILTTTWKPKKHKSSVEATMSSFRVTHLFKTAHSDESPLLAEKEATFAYHATI